MSKISNCLLMLEYLENGRKYNIKVLAEKLEVSERMVRSYKEELEKAGIFIDSIMGPYGGYEFLKSLEVNEEDKEKLQIIADKVHGIYFESQNENIELKDDIKNYYNILYKAIKEKRKVKINYYSFTDGNLNRIIRPYDLFLYNSGWGCAAFCELRQDLRHFELKRINKMDLLDETF